MEEDCELLFFDTFSHGTSEDLNLDLVQFPRPVYIHEIRIIPLGARVQADFPGGHRLGATNPSSFELEFFVNDLSRLGACTFKKLGILAYQQNVDIQFPVPTKIPTDGLVLRGWYCTITLAVYGNLTKVCKERSSPPPPPPPPQSNSRNPPVDIRPVQPVEFDCSTVKPVTVSIPDWDRPQLLEPPVEIPPAPVCAHPPLPSVVEASHYSEPLPVVRAEQCPPSFVEHAPAPVYVEGPGLNYQKRLNAPLPSGPPQQIVPPPSSYPPYDVPHTKPWPQPDDNYARDSEAYQRQVYGRQDAKMYGGPGMNVHPMWEHPEIRNSQDIPERGHERMIYPHDPAHEHKPIFHREKENETKDRDRDRSWEKERDTHLDYKDEERQSRNSGRDSKRRDRDHKSRDNNWDRQSQDSSDRYSRDRERDRDRSRDSNTRERDKEKDRDRERDKERNRDRPRERFRDTGRDKGSGSRSRDSSRESHDRQSRPDLNRKSTASPSPSSPPKAHRPRTPQSPVSADAEKTSAAGPRTPKDDEPGEIVEEGGSEEPAADDLFEPLTPDPLPSDQYNLSDGEIQDGNLEEDDVYETIVSDEEIMSDDDERVIEMVELDYDMGDETWNYMSSFNPFQYEVTPLQHFHDPSMTQFEVLREQLKGKESEMDEEAQKLLQVIKQFADKEHTEKWVEAVENIAISMPTSGLASTTDETVLNSTVDTLIDWILEGLDFEAALKQPQPVYKVRHLKAGIRLAAALFQTDVKIIERLLEKSIPQKLLVLYDQPYMALPVKLLILRALDATIFTKQGMQYFIEKSHPYEKKSDLPLPKIEEGVPDIKVEIATEGEVKAEMDKDNEKKVQILTGYQRLLDILIPQQSTRAVVAIKALLQKIHLGEILHELRNAVERLVQSTAISEAKAATESSSTDEHASMDNDAESSPTSLVGDAQAEIFIRCLNNITNIYKTAKKSVAQPLRYLPARRQFDTSQTSFDPYPGLYRMLQENFLLESLFVLVSSPASSAHSDILTAVRELLLEFLQSQSGILFLLSNPDATNGIHRALLQAVDDSREESAEDNMTHLLGMQIVCHLQALQFVDILLAYHSRGGPKKEMDEPDAVSALHHLYTMIFIPIGRTAVVNVLSSEHNLEALLPFVQMTGEEEYDTKLSKSVCTGYVTELLLLTVHCSERVSMIEYFAEALINLSTQESTPKLHELSLWMAPTKKIPSYTHEAIPHLMGHIKTASENAASLPQELITALRILQHITIPSNHSTKAKEEDKELKYKYAIIQVFSNDGLSCFLTILQKICDTLLKPSNQSVALVGLQGILVTAIVKPVIVLIQFMLQYLIFCRGTEFKDLTAIPVLLRAHLLMSFVPVTSFSYTLAQQVQSEIVETFLAYTQPYIGSSESEEALSKSLWTQMVEEILKFLFQSSNTFVTGLSVFSELLPLPLPLQTREPLSADEVSRAVNCRKLWSAHLHSLSTTVQEIIISLSPSSCHPLQQLLRRVCVQLADLATPTALVVVRSVLDALLDSMIPPVKVEEKTDAAPNPVPQWEVKACSTATARILNLMAYLISHAPFKIPLISVLRGSVKTDEKYGEVLTMILSHLNYESDKPSHIHSQECIVSILQSLCDPDIGFVTLEGGASVNDVLANSLPPKEHISEICGALIQHIGNHRHTFASVLPSLRALVMLTEHDYGFFHLRQALIQYPGALCSLFDRLSSSFSKDSSDCLSTLSTTLEFLRVMVHGFEEPIPARTQVLSTNELCKILQWSKSSHDTGSKNHDNSAQKDIKANPLFELERLLTECANDEEALESLLESVNGFVQILSTTKEDKVEREIIEPLLPPAESQSAQFSVRPVYIVGEVDEERLSPSYWLSVPVAEETDQEAEQVPLDLVALSEKYWSDFDLKDNLEKLCLSTEIDSEVKAKKKSTNGLGKRKYHPIVNSTNSESNNKKPFIAPMRGRGFGRGTSHSSRANDPFRSRPPNTSRPPSMHVDDFVALEHHHHHQQPSSSVPSTTKRSTKDTSRGRGRGFDSGRTFGTARGAGGGGGGGGGGGSSGGSGGGRFFSPPGPYSRRDANRAGNTRGAARGATNAWGRTGSGTPTKAQNSGVRGFGRGGGSHMEQRQSTQRNRDSYSNNTSAGNAGGGRFSRGSHGMGISSQGHWGDTRNKQQDGRFGSTNSSTRGRRDNQSRHARSFTR